MIDQIIVKNIQSHKSSKLKLHPGVNVIIGKTDSGKTALMRGLKWLSTNRPKGDSIRSDWGGDSSFSVVTNGHVVKRNKTDKVNQYSLRRVGEKDKLTFNAVGLGVPEEIERALNLNEINLQSQFDQPFLLNSSPGEVASHFNKIAHLDKIDTSLKKINQWVRGLEQEQKSGEVQLIDSKEELESYDYLEKFEIEIEVLETLEKVKLQATNSKAKLVKVVKDAKETQTKIDTNAVILAAEKPVNKILTLYTEKESIAIQKQKLAKLLQENEKFTEELKEEEDIIEMEESVSALLLLFKKRETLKKEFLALVVMVDGIKMTGRNVKATNIQIKKKQELFKAEMPTVCPLCNQKIKKS